MYTCIRHNTVLHQNQIESFALLSKVRYHYRTIPFLSWVRRVYFFNQISLIGAIWMGYEPDDQTATGSIKKVLSHSSHPFSSQLLPHSVWMHSLVEYFIVYLNIFASKKISMRPRQGSDNIERRRYLLVGSSNGSLILSAFLMKTHCVLWDWMDTCFFAF